LSSTSARRDTLRAEHFWMNAAQAMLFRYTNRVLVMDNKSIDTGSSGLLHRPDFRDDLGC
jgi:hypothetical protein